MTHFASSVGERVIMAHSANCRTAIEVALRRSTPGWFAPTRRPVGRHPEVYTMSDQDVIDELTSVLSHRLEKRARLCEILGRLEDPAHRMILEAEVQGLDEEIDRLEYHIETIGGDNE
jgi:DNA polymerase I-like protein with 3'-5' exonuclease and polymerase domains